MKRYTTDKKESWTGGYEVRDIRMRKINTGFPFSVQDVNVLYSV